MSGWGSSSASVGLHSTARQDPEYIKNALSAFLQAALVAGSNAGEPTVAMYAARSTQGLPVRFLVKVKDQTAKIDVKSTNAVLAKALAADIKRLVLM